MSYLFWRTFSQGLQALMPIVAALLWCRAHRAPRLSSAITRGLMVSVPMSLLAAALFNASAHQSLDEALLAVSALVIAAISARWLSRPHAPTTLQKSTLITFSAVAAASSLIVVRQTMEIVLVFWTAAVQIRSLDATSSIAGGLVAAVVVIGACSVFGRRLPERLLPGTMWTFVAAFIGQGLIYAFHESAEARLLPWSEFLHAATEPYSPEGLYGVHFSELLVLAPLGAVGLTWGREKLHARNRRDWRLVTRHRPAIAISAFLSCIVIGLQQSDARPPQAAPRSRPDDIAAAVARPHVLFRNTAPGSNFRALSTVALDLPDGARQVTGVTCQRLSFAGGRGLCLHLQRGVFNTYTAVLLDGSLTPGASIKLQGLPSRTRISADGRVGAVTVFVIGDDYAAEFSTRTTLVDLASGEEIGELEQFSTWRDGARIRAVDFNFWGVTFAKDGNTFFAALRTAGKTYLVRGELGLRRLTVVRENVECPSLSPDNQLLAYKKRVGPSPDSWRLHVLDLQTNVERIVASEERYIDDQVEWLDARHLLYGVPRRTTAVSDVWVASIDGSEPPRIFISEAESPSVVR